MAVGGGSDPPQQEVVGAVVAPHALAAVGQAEVLVAIAAADHQHFGFGQSQAGVRRVALLLIIRLLGAWGGGGRIGRPRLAPPPRAWHHRPANPAPSKRNHAHFRPSPSHPV